MDSSVWEEPYFVRVLFMTLMALKDPDHVVRKTSYALSKRGNMTEQEVMDGLKILSEPDKRRVEPQPFEGRRIQQQDGGGWLILNAQKYVDLIAEEKKVRRRIYMRNYQRKKRAGQGTPIAGETAAVKDFENGATDKDGLPIKNGICPKCCRFMNLPNPKCDNDHPKQ